MASPVSAYQFHAAQARRLARHEARVSVQRDAVGLVRERAENLALGFGRLGEHRERLGWVRRDDHGVVAFGTLARDDGDAAVAALDARDRLAREDAARDPFGCTLHVDAASADDASPHRLAGHVQQAVVVAEAQERPCGVLEQQPGRRRPDRVAHRQQVPVDEGRRVALPFDQLAKRDLVDLGVGEQSVSVSAELEHAGEHREELGVDDVGTLREDRVEIGARPLDVLGADLYREGHVRLGPLDAEQIEEPDEVGVRARVEDLEARVGREGGPFDGQVDGVRVAAEALLGLVDVHGVLRRQKPCRPDSCDAGSDDCDPHLRTPSCGYGDWAEEAPPPT